MKKWSTLLMASALMLALAACGSGSDSGSGDGETYKFATDAAYAPMEFMDKDKIVGFDADFLDAVMEEAGLKYELVNTGWDGMLELVKQGTEYDGGISSVSITDERKETYDYTVPYFESRNMIMVKADSDIQNALDLADKKVAVQVSTTADILMTEIMGVDNTNLKRFDSNSLAILEMDSGGVDAVVADFAVVWEYVENNPDKNYKYISDAENFSAEFYGILLPKGSELKAKLDPAIKEVLENGTYADIYKEWFGEEPNVEALLNAE